MALAIGYDNISPFIKVNKAVSIKRVLHQLAFSTCNMKKRKIVKLPGSHRLREFLKDLLGIRALHRSIAAIEKRIETTVQAHQKRIDGFEDRSETDILALQRRVGQLEEHVYESKTKLAELDLARGYFNGIEYNDNRLSIYGWLMLFERGFDSVALYVNQVELAKSKMIESEYLARDYHFISHANNSGFSFKIHRPIEEMGGMIDICVVGIARGRKIAKMETWYRNDLSSCFPVPPLPLMLRECNTDIISFNLLTGLKNYREFWTTACKYVDPPSIKSMLDWGCGYGRVTGFFIKFSGIPQVSGCDIDAEAISWARENLKPAEFSLIAPYPPTHYPDHAFDLIISNSVFTHLARGIQVRWLEEMRRVLAPGGLFLASVHGESAATFNFPGRKAIDVLMDGIYDGLGDAALDGVAPDGYYRAVFQSKEYTLREYSRYFEVVEYIERGSLNYQDLIIMRKRS